MDVLKEQIEKTLRKLRSGEIHREDRVFLNHVLEEFVHLIEMTEKTSENVETLMDEMIGSTRELVEDGLT